MAAAATEPQETAPEAYAGMDRFRDPTRYEPDEDLVAAVQVAAMLRQPLLLTGDPGAGKSQLAAWLAHRLKRPLIRFTAKSTTTATDLLYRFDAVREFRDSQPGASGASDKQRYLTFQALGRAVVLTYPAGAPEMLATWDDEANRVPGEADARPPAPTASVVLIDEIDKAPRDVPNDLLAEFETGEFNVPEVGVRLHIQGRLQPIVVVASNSEKSLPDAFLRRCVFHHIAMPTGERLRRILEAQMPELSLDDPLVRDALEVFHRLQGPSPDLVLRKRPSVPELLGLLLVFCGPQPVGAAAALSGPGDNVRMLLRDRGLREGLRASPRHRAAAAFMQVLSVLFKTRDDQEAAREWLRDLWALPEEVVFRAAPESA